MPDSSLGRRRILVVEDEYFLADELDMALTEAGAAVLGPAPSVDAALRVLDQGIEPDIAVLDINLGGELAYPVADVLADRGIPFLFTTGYDQSSLPERHAAVRRLEKPVEPSAILEAVERLILKA
jgi:CheY-like chemotaxis protein